MMIMIVVVQWLIVGIGIVNSSVGPLKSFVYEYRNIVEVFATSFAVRPFFLSSDSQYARYFIDSDFCLSHTNTHAHTEIHKWVHVQGSTCIRWLFLDSISLSLLASRSLELGAYIVVIMHCVCVCPVCVNDDNRNNNNNYAFVCQNFKMAKNGLCSVHVYIIRQHIRCVCECNLGVNSIILCCQLRRSF